MAWDFPVKKTSVSSRAWRAISGRPESEPVASQQIHDWVKAELRKREGGTANRASSAYQCVRRRWFQNQGLPGEPLNPRSILVFATGDVIEHVLKYMIEKGCVGPNKLYSEVDFGKKTGETFTIQDREFETYAQEQVVTKIGDLDIPGHPDGWGKRNSDGRWELIEIKSSAVRGYDAFVKGKCDYLEQTTTLMMSDRALSLGVTDSRFFYMNKNTQALYDRLYQFDETMAKRVEREYWIAAGRFMPAIPVDADVGPRIDRATGKQKLGWKCGYCPYTSKCWPAAKLAFQAGKPVYYLKKEGYI